MNARKGQTCWIGHCGSAIQVTVARGFGNQDIHTCSECAYRHFFGTHTIVRLPWAP